MRRLRPLLAVLACLLALPAVAADELVVVVHPRNALPSITREELSKLFLKRTDKWPDGTPARPCDLSSTSSVRKSFSTAVHGRSLFVIMAYWQQEIAAGRSTPPSVCATEDVAVEWVRRNAGGVAYVSADTPLNDVKVLPVKP